MINNDFMVELIAVLNNAKSTKQVNQDIKSIEKTVNALRLTATLLKGDSKKQLNTIINELESNVKAVKVKTTFDSKQAQKAVNDALKNVSINDLNFNGQGIKLKARKIFTEIKSEVSKTPIPINFEIRKDTLQNQLTSYLTKNSKISESSVLLGEADALRGLFNNIDSRDSFRYATDKFRLFRSEVTATGFASKSTSDKIGGMIGNVTKIGTLFGVAGAGLRNYVKGVSTLKQMDTLLTEISKTSNIAGENLKRLGEDSFGLASKYGQVSTNYLEGVREMARSGYDSLAKELGELSVLAQSAGDMTAEMANNYLLATDAAYKYGGSVEKLTAALDGANYISNRNSATLTDIADATRVSASFAAEAGVQIDELTAATATMVAGTKRSGSEMGRAFRSIVMNLQQVSGEFDGEVFDEDSFAKVEKRLHSVGVAMEEVSNGAAVLRNPMDILKDLAKVYNSLPEGNVDKGKIISDLGGKYWGNALSSLLSRWDTYDKMLTEFSQGSGSSLKEAMKTADSWEGRLNKLQNTWNSFVGSMTNQDYIKGGISFLDSTISGFQTLTETVGALPVLLTAVNASLTALNKDYGLTQLFNSETRKIDVQGNIMGVDFTAIKAQKKHFEEATGAISEWNGELVTGQADINKFGDSVVKNNAQLRDYLSTCSKDAPASLKGYQAYLNAAGVSTDALRLKTVALNAAISFGVGAAVQFAISKVGKEISDYIHRNQIAIASADELKSTLASNISTINEHQSSLDSLSDRFAELSKGVDDYGNNISLTKDQMKEYTGIVADLIAINPALLKGYDAENQAIIDKNTALEDTVALLERERELELEKATSTSNLKTIGEGAVAKRNELLGSDFTGQFSSYDLDTVTGQAVRFGTEAAKVFDDESIKAFYDYTNSKPSEKMYGKSDWLKTFGFDVSDENVDLDIEGYLQRNIDTFSKNMDEILIKANIDPSSDQAKNLKLYVQEWQTLNSELETIDSSYIDEHLQKIPQLVSGYDALTNSQKSFINEYIRNGFSAYDLENDAVKVKSSITGMVESISDDPKIKNKINDLFALNAKDLNVTDYADQYNQILDGIISDLNLSDSDANKLRVNLTIDADHLQEKFDNAIASAKEKFDGNDLTQFFSDNSINTSEEIDAWLEIAQAANSATEAEKLYLEELEKSKEKAKSFVSEFSNLPVDKIEKYISLLNSGDMTEGNISSFTELKDLMSQTSMSAEGAVKAIKDYADGFTLSTDLISNIQGAFDLLKDVEEQYKKTGLIGLSSLESIAKQYPQLQSSVNEYTQGLIGADEVMSQLHTAYDNDAVSFRTAMAYKMSGNEDFFDSIVNNNQSLFNALAEAYGDDVNNWKTLAQAKADIDKSLISQLADMWGSYYGSFDANVVKGKDGQYSLVSDDPTAVYESGYQAIEQEIAKRNQMIRSLNEAANVEIIIPDFGGIGSAGKKSGSGKDKDTSKPFDWIERDLKLLNEQREKALNKARDTSIDYFGLTNEEFNRAKELFNDSTGMVGDKANELANFAKQAGISLSDLYTLIANGNPGESRENYLAQVLELDKTILPRTELAVESYKKIWEDAASKISPENKVKIEQGYKDVETLPGEEAEGVQTAIDAYDKWQAIQDSYTESQKKNTDAIMAQYDNRINAINKENEQLEKTNSVLESRMDYLKSIGEIPSASLYENLISNTGTEISNTQKLISELKGKLKEARTKYGKDSEEYINLKENIDDAEASLYTTMQTQEKYNQALAQMPIEHLSTLISMYDDITAKIENWGSVQTATGAKLDGEYYQTLISNGTTVIGQYQKQIKEIKSLMSEYREGSTIWQELYEQLQDIDSATASMLTNLKKWNAELLAMPLDKINTYSDSLQKVISGLTDVRSELDSATSAITTAISDRIDLLQEEQKVAAEAHETEIDALEEKAEALKRVNEVAEKKLAVERAEYDLARAKGQKSNLEIRDGEQVYSSDYDAVRQAQDALANSKADLEEYNLQRQIEDARTALDNLNDGYQEQIDALEKISKKYSDISSSADKISKANLATSLFGEGFADKVLSGNDKEIYATLTSLYTTNAKQLDEYQKQAESTSNIESLMSDYINSYKAGEITYDQALGKINGLLAQLNQNMSASTNLQNIYDYLGIVNGVGADADSILKGIKEGLSVTADNLIKSLEQYNKNSGMISEYTSSWQQLTDNVASMLDVMKDVRDNLRDSLDDYDRDDDDNDNTRYGGGKDGSPGTPGKGEYVNSGPGVPKYAKGIENGPVGNTSSSDSDKMIKYLATNNLKKGEVPILAHTGEVIFNEEQKKMLLKNFGNTQRMMPNTDVPNYSKTLQNAIVKQQGQAISISYGDLSFPNVRNVDDAIAEFAQLSEIALRQELSKFK
ncbi:phage tail tape measure protein [Lacrimispora sp.]|uniref:phage tail tape measure protein n=1 Tax=Lacrimispora sp. TaxID=2719234 RepID=UPI00345F7435